MRCELFACILTVTASSAAMAGERDAVPPKVEAGAVMIFPAPSTGKATPAAHDRPTPFVLPVRSAPAERRATTMLLDGSGAEAGFDLRDAGEPSGRPADSAEGASRAVREALDDHRKPRQPRSVLSTALVLRIDGNRDSPSLSVGGGGVAGAVWSISTQMN